MKIHFKGNQDITQLQQSRIAMHSSRSAAEQQAVAPGMMNQLSFTVALSESQLQLLHYLIQNYPASSFFDRLSVLANEISACIAGLKDPEQRAFFELLQKQIVSIKESIVLTDTTRQSVERGFEVFRHMEQLKNNLLLLLNDIQQGRISVKLKDTVESFINHLETIKLFNYEGLASINTHDALLFFPLIVSLGKNGEDNIDLWIQPQFDEDGTVKQDAFHFVIAIESESLGRIALDCSILDKNLSCVARVETSHAKKVVEENIDMLARRLKKVQCVLSGFNCVHEDNRSMSERLFSKIEMTA